MVFYDVFLIMYAWQYYTRSDTYNRELVLLYMISRGVCDAADILPVIMP